MWQSKHKIWLASLLCMLWVGPVAAQLGAGRQPVVVPNVATGTTESIWNRLSPGGSLALQFGNPTLIEVSPFLGYLISNTTTVGLGATYIYYSVNANGRSFATNTYGGRLFARQFVAQNIFAQVEWEALNFPRYINSQGDTERFWYNSPMVGAGFFQPLGSRGGFSIMLLYALNYSAATSPYSSPVQVRIGYNF